MTVEEIIADAASYFTVWHDVLLVFFFLLATGLFACFVSYHVLQWIGELTLGDDHENSNKKAKGKINEANERE